MTENATASHTTTDAARPAGACAVCPHMWDAHDALGMRFCTATQAAAKDRGCICRSSAAAV